MFISSFAVPPASRLYSALIKTVGPLLLLLPITLLAGGRGRQATLTSGLVFGGAFGALFLMAVWARLNVHHFVQFAAPIAMVVPVAIVRAIDTFTPTRIQSALTGLMSLLGIAWIGLYGPWAGKPVDDLATAEQNQLLGWMINGVNMHFDADAGDQLLDCSGLGVEAALLPRRLNAGLPNFQTSATAERCQRWMLAPQEISGRQWLITRQEPEFSGPSVPPWVQVEAWVDGPRKTWLWMHRFFSRILDASRLGFGRLLASFWDQRPTKNKIEHRRRK